eukprot:gb/GEZN01007947.1/.p1 GENE.gb/GEZN01007947.1/~~gb/GEZN01007947.1/.p1  ORF type:complete len:433 (+),score=63.19 gb/GEZN01007947.1/:84-1301(+)
MLTGLALLAVAGFASRNLVSMNSSAPRGAFVPKAEMETVLVRPGAPGPLHVFSPSDSLACIFSYDKRDEAFGAGASRTEGWCYGAKLLPGPTAYATGNPGDVIKGTLLCWSSSEMVGKLSAAGAMNDGMAREVVHVVRADGTSIKAYCYLAHSRTEQTVPKNWVPGLVLKADTWSQEVLERELLSLAKMPLPPGRARWLVGLVGIPGSGKSYLASRVCANVNSRGKADLCTVVPMDGFHLTRKQLDQMPDPALAHKRRGAEWTFDAEGFGALLKTLRVQPGKVLAPSFDHEKKDPVENDISIGPQPIALVEGLYLFLEKPAWRQHVGPNFDRRWVLLTDPDVAEERVIKRHLEAGIASTRQEAQLRWDTNDWPNGKEVLQYMDQTKIDHFIRIDDLVKQGRPLLQ